MVNKKAWIRIVEASFAIILIAGIMVFVISSNSGNRDISKEIYLFEEGILNEIRINSTLRQAVLNTTESTGIPRILENYLDERVPRYLKCEFVICEMGGLCNLDNGDIYKEVFGRSIVLSSEGEFNEPRIISLFCWKMESF